MKLAKDSEIIYPNWANDANNMDSNQELPPTHNAYKTLNKKTMPATKVTFNFSSNRKTSKKFKKKIDDARDVIRMA